MDERKICPLMKDAYSSEQMECLRDGCAWFVGEWCAVAYMGANCRANLHPWRENESKAAGHQRMRAVRFDESE